MLSLSIKLFWYLIPVAVIIITSCSSGKGDDSSAPLSDSSLERAQQITGRILKNSPIKQFEPETAEKAKIVSVLDGHRIEVELVGTDKDDQFVVRYAGIDVPANVALPDPIHGTKPLGEVASDRNRELVEGQVVLLETGREEEDLNGYKLRYVYLNDIMINSVLVYEGLAKVEVASSGEPSKYMRLLSELQNKSMIDRNGGWENDWKTIKDR